MFLAIKHFTLRLLCTAEQMNSRIGRGAEENTKGGLRKIMNCLHDYVMRTVSKEEDNVFWQNFHEYSVSFKWEQLCIK